jgi:hypothetical protein
VEDVVRPVDGHEVRAFLVVAEDGAVEEEGQVDDAAADQEAARALERLRQDEPGGPEEQVDDVVQDGTLLGVGPSVFVKPGESGSFLP